MIVFAIRTLIPIAYCVWSAKIEGATSASLTERLKQHFSPGQSMAKTSGVIVQRPGILSVPEADVSFLDVCPSVFRASEVHSTAGSFCADLAKRSQKSLAVSDRAYVTRILVNGAADRVSFYLARCESCAAGKPSVVLRALLVFEFPKSYLAKADGDEVIRAVEQVLAAESPTDGPSRAEAGSDANITVRRGLTPDQVAAILGKPQAIIDLETKVIYSYRDLKLVFVAGKLEDVQ